MLQIILYTIGRELALDRVSGAAHAGSFRIAALNHEAFDDAVKSQPVVEFFVRELFEVFDRDRRDVRIKLAGHDAAVPHCDCHFVNCHCVSSLLRIILRRGGLYCRAVFC